MKKIILLIVISLFAFSANSQRVNSSELFLKMWNSTKFSVNFDNNSYPQRTSMFELIDIDAGSHKLVVFKRSRRGRRYSKRRIIFSGYIDIPESSKVYAKINKYRELVISRIEPIVWDDEEDDNTLPELNIASVIQSMDNASFSSDKKIIAEQAISTHAVWTNQIAQILRKFDFESDKLKMAKFAYGFCIDKEKYYTINNVFDFSSSIRELNKYIQNFRP